MLRNRLSSPAIWFRSSRSECQGISMAERTRWRLGSWTFDAEGARLIEGENETPLEHRAARTLEPLCRERGQLVTREAILAHVWEGRSVSANSVAVVIADLRRALGDDAGAPASSPPFPNAATGCPRRRCV